MKKPPEDFSDLPQTDDQLNELPSKSQRKRDALLSVDLAKALQELPHSKRGRFNLTTEISDALKLGDEIRSNGARKRQLHYIGKLLRNSADYDSYLQKHEDPQLKQATPIAEEDPRQAQDRTMHARLLDDLAGAMTDLRSQYPNANVQLIRQLVNRINKSESAADSERHGDDKDSQLTKLQQRLGSAIAEGRAK